MTVAATEKLDGDIALSNLVVAVPAGAERMIGPFPPQAFNALDGSGLADVTWSATASVTFAPLKLSRP